MTDDNRQEYCWRIGGSVYMRSDKPCPECGVVDTHIPKSKLRSTLHDLQRDNKSLEELVRWVEDNRNPCTCKMGRPECEWCVKSKSALEGE